MKLYKFKIRLLKILFTYLGKRTSAQTSGPSNMGEIINVSAPDAEPKLTPDAQQLYTMNNCPGSMGG
jgi:hypothetical protein